MINAIPVRRGARSAHLKGAHPASLGSCGLGMARVRITLMGLAINAWGDALGLAIGLMLLFAITVRLIPIPIPIRINACRVPVGARNARMLRVAWVVILGIISVRLLTKNVFKRVWLHVRLAVILIHQRA
jgi:hypothetical protein